MERVVIFSLVDDSALKLVGDCSVSVCKRERERGHDLAYHQSLALVRSFLVLIE